MVYFPQGFDINTIEGAVPGAEGEVKINYRPKGSKNKKNEITNREAAAKLGSSAGGFIKRMGKWVLPALGAKEIFIEQFASVAEAMEWI